MKVKFLFLASFIISNLIACSQSKSETIDWLNSKLKLSPIYASSTEQQTRFITISQDGSFKVASREYRVDAIPGVDSPRWRTNFTGLFKDLSPKSVSALKKGNCFLISAQCTNSKELVTQTDFNDNGTTTTYKTRGILFCYVLANSEPDIEKRVVKAIKHLILIFGGKEDTF